MTESENSDSEPNGRRDRRGGPLHRELSRTLRAEIAAGEYDIGGKFPTEMELCDRFGVSRHTVRAAMADLRQSGLISRQRGVGTTVLSYVSQARYILRASDEDNAVRQYTESTRFELIDEPGPAAVFDSRRLLLGDARDWLKWTGLRRTVDNPLPMGFNTYYIPTKYAVAVRDRVADAQTAVFPRITREFGLTLKSLEQSIAVTLLDDHEAEHLRAAAGSPALAITRRFITEDGLIGVFEGIHPADRYATTMRFDVEISE